MMFSELYLLMYCPGIYLSIQTNQTLIYNNLRLEHIKSRFLGQNQQKVQDEGQTVLFNMSYRLVYVFASVCCKNLEQWSSQSSVAKETALIVELLLLLWGL